MIRGKSNGQRCGSRYRRYLDGDDNGLIEIIEIYHEGLTLYLNSIVNNICLAEELMQDTFVRLAVKKPRFNGRQYFKTWLYSIAKHCAIDYMRKNSKISYFPIDEAFQMSDEEDIERNYLREEQKIELHKAIKQLKPEYAQVLYLKHFEDFDTAEIASIMKKSKKQVGDLLYRAKNALKAELEKEGIVYEKL